LGIRFSSPERRLSGCHTLDARANAGVRARTAPWKTFLKFWRARFGAPFLIIEAQPRAKTSDEEENSPMQNLPRIESVEQAREALTEMNVDQEITAELDEWKASIKKLNDQEFSVSFADYETGIINLWNASHILLEYGDHDLYVG
jgi:hypothetical protein